jgi:hypothetical protein
MKKSIFSLTMLFLLSNCIFPFAGRQMINLDLNAQPNSIRHEKQGALLVFGVIPSGSLLDLKAEILNAKQANQCKDLKNLDILYYQHNYYIVGWEKLVLQADCVK